MNTLFLMLSAVKILHLWIVHSGHLLCTYRLQICGEISFGARKSKLLSECLACEVTTIAAPNETRHFRVKVWYIPPIEEDSSLDNIERRSDFARARRLQSELIEELVRQVTW